VVCMQGSGGWVGLVVSTDTEYAKIGNPREPIR
jgi:hypothetical protein